MRLSEEKRLVYISDSQETAPWQEGVQKESGGEVSVIRISSTEDLTAVFRENPSCFVLEDVGQGRDSIRQRIQQIRQHDRWVPIIVLLNTMVAERRLEVYRDGADGYICHPFFPWSFCIFCGHCFAGGALPLEKKR